MSLEPATTDDIPAIRAIELNPDYALFIGNFSAEAHAANMASDDYRYFAWRQDGRLVAFAILAKLTDPADVVLLKRLGSSVTDTGLSRRMMPALIDWVFENTPANRSCADAMDGKAAVSSMTIMHRRHVISRGF